jgi:DNA mismatch endonuclease (patch repair protein)
MPDVFTPDQRSALMSRIRGSGNRDTELRMIKLFRAHGITGWRRKQKLFGKPDFVFRRERVAVFVDGCFWHGCPKPKHAPSPKNRADWWAEKLGRNRLRDQEVTERLLESGWHVVRVWECDLASKNWPAVANRVQEELRVSPASREVGFT